MFLFLYAFNDKQPHYLPNIITFVEVRQTKLKQILGSVFLADTNENFEVQAKAS